MSLAEKQQLFANYLGQLLVWIYQQPGYAVTLGEAYRTPEQAALNAAKGSGIARSLHTDRLAIDLNLFIDGVYQSQTDAYKRLGIYWRTLDILCCWGGDFHTRQDGNHFSITDGGRQ